MVSKKDWEEKQDWSITTPNNELVETVPGKNGEFDMKIFTSFPKMPWAHSLYYIATCLRLKGMVENRNYPNGTGRGYLASFCLEAIFSKVPISELCKKYKIKEKE